jgi:hypothetical protein
MSINRTIAADHPPSLELNFVHPAQGRKDATFHLWRFWACGLSLYVYLLDRWRKASQALLV